ncbi:uncharacterized protein LOC141702730 [Apium graveolens]|uniref:uncharacterized protein LOC141702730 n=1 Tax=Apium graveolens TaxID=4045 RepID=UPI003D7BE7F4
MLSVDAPDIVSRVFKLKLDQLLDLIKKNYFGKCIGEAWLATRAYANLGALKADLILLKRFNGNTYFDDCGFPVYRRRNTGRVINKKGINLDNQYKKSNKSGSEQTARSVKNLDEVKNFLDGRYVCASEASWRIFGFNIHHRSPSVERLPIHLPGQKYLNFQISADLENVCNNTTSKKSKLEAWFVANSEFPQARNFTYSDFPTQFTWIKKTSKWKLRQRGDVVGSCALLMELHMIHLRKACGALGLLNNDKQWHDALEENALSAMPIQIRAMFVNILAYCSVSDPLALWEQHWPALSDDVLYIRRKISDNIHLTMSEYEIQNYALAEIEKLLNDVGKSLRDFHMMPFPDERFFHTFVNRLIAEETSYNKEELRLNHDKAHKNLNSRQLDVYNAVVDNVNKNKGGMFFVYGSGGCGKMFLWQTLCSRFRSEGKIVLPVAGSGIAATLLPGGRTAHSRFKIPLKLDQSSIAGIKHGTDIAELMQHTSLIIWDEAPMQHRYAIEAVDRSLRDIMAAVDVERGRRPFGGIIVVFGGDFSTNITCNSEARNKVIADFSKWQLDIGDGKVECIDTHRADVETEFVVPDEYVVKSPLKTPIKTLIDIIYPDFQNNLHSQEYLRSRSILTPTNVVVVVDDINAQILERVPGNMHTYLSQDSIEDRGVDDNDFDSSFPVEYLNSINMPCMPKHELKVKVGAVVMLMRNLNQIMGLCNGTRMIVTGCKKTV